ncbi:cytochrome c oxidase assembly factor Coa1 family protein [Leminorella grimontii]|uniref:cytochrome c oxidase assembly factor Coa1 family protein n=1 Tax=Leminorella grimontii TaxID=82981 RepID=UPI002084C3E9|nr:cytochrome c oxidase assembly factor Coa1 family protein [Leminorella grimontii]GKX59164.1 hypothetical protein SOASR031_14790 [Leminorella grimontii]
MEKDFRPGARSSVEGKKPTLLRSKWLWIAIAAVVVLALIITFTVRFIVFSPTVSKNYQFYHSVAERVKSDRQVIALLGEPLDVHPIPLTSPCKDQECTHFTSLIKGSKMTGQIEIEAIYSSDRWVTQSVRLRLLASNSGIVPDFSLSTIKKNQVIELDIKDEPSSP